MDLSGEAPAAVDAQDNEVAKWLVAVKGHMTADQKVELRWLTSKLPIEAKWADLWKASSQLHDFGCRKKLLDWIPQFELLPRSPPFNMPGRKPPALDKVWRQLDDQCRDLARAVRCLHLSMLQDQQLLQASWSSGSVIPSVAVQIENIWALTGALSHQCTAQRLRAIDIRLDPDAQDTEGIVGKPEYDRLDQVKKMASKLPPQPDKKPFKGQQWKPNPFRSGHHNGYTNYGKGRGRGRGSSSSSGSGRGRGRGNKFFFQNPAASKEAPLGQ